MKIFFFLIHDVDVPKLGYPLTGAENSPKYPQLVVFNSKKSKTLR
jgi:hypothetical protein